MTLPPRSQGLLISLSSAGLSVSRFTTLAWASLRSRPLEMKLDGIGFAAFAGTPSLISRGARSKCWPDQSDWLGDSGAERLCGIPK